MEAITLPPLDTPYPVTTAQKGAFDQDGHILLKGILSAEEVAVYRSVIRDAAQHFNQEKRDIADRDTYGKAFLQIMNLWEVDESVRKFTLARRFGQIAAALLGVERVRLYHDQALFKEPGGGHTPWHQDQYYWPIDTDKTITMWMPLVDITEEMGMLTFASGSQELGFLGNLAISDDSETILGNLVKEKGYPLSRAKTMQAGDATFHAGWTLHCAPGNQSTAMREVMTIIFFADGAKVTPPVNDNQWADLNRWMPGASIGAPIATPLNPVLS